jgi:hypothetical protein
VGIEHGFKLKVTAEDTFLKALAERLSSPTCTSLPTQGHDQAGVRRGACLRAVDPFSVVLQRFGQWHVLCG